MHDFLHKPRRICVCTDTYSVNMCKAIHEIVGAVYRPQKCCFLLDELWQAFGWAYANRNYATMEHGLVYWTGPLIGVIAAVQTFVLFVA